MKKTWSIMLALMLMLSLMPTGAITLAADPPSTGTVKADKLYVRSGPARTNNAVGELANNTVVVIHETVTNDSGERWHRISKDDITGYVHADYIVINAVYETDEEFEAYLTAQGFPEDYKIALRQVHAQYPNWIFRAQHLSMTWAEAYAAECRVRLNTIYSPEAWKSMEPGAYDWSNNAYINVDGGWVTASPSVVAYFMDPRNWLDSTYIFQFEDLSYSGGETLAGVQAILPDALDIHAEDLLKASQETGVSAYFLATRITQEGSHLNGLGTGTVPGYEGYYNFFHIKAYAGGGQTAVQNGAAHAKSQGWDTPYKSLLGGAQFLGKGYINLGQNTLYYQKFNLTNTTSGLYAHQYMTNVAAPSSEGSNRRKAVTEAELNSGITFIIPVFKSMPATVAPMPSKEGNNNNFLDNITVEGYSLTPTFGRYTMSYSLHVGEATSINIAATLNNPAAKLEGVGTIQLYKGDNEIPLTVTATSGEKRVYKVTVTTTGGVERPNAPVIDESTPAFTINVLDAVVRAGDTFTVTVNTKNNPGIVSLKVDVGYDADVLELTNIAGQDFVGTSFGPLTNNPIAINWFDALNPNNTTDGVVAVLTFKVREDAALGDTAITLSYNPNNVYDYDFENVEFATVNGAVSVVEYTPGDVNGDGDVNNKDLGLLQRYINGWDIDVVAAASDVNADGDINNKDLGVLQRYINGWEVELK